MMYLKYRNSDARHHYETETNKKLFNLRKVDDFVKRETGLSNATIVGANNKRVSGQGLSEMISENVINTFKDSLK